jgi:hypothetical protein
MIQRFIRTLRLRLMPDRAAKAIQRQIRDARAKHKPVRHLQAALRDLRHKELSRAR